MSEYKPTPSTTLAEFFENTYLTERPLKKSGMVRYRDVIKAFSKALGRPARVIDLARPFPESLKTCWHPPLNTIRRFAIDSNLLQRPEDQDLRPTAQQPPVRPSTDKPTPQTALMEFLAFDYMQSVHWKFSQNPGRAAGAIMAVIVRRFSKIIGRPAKVLDLNEDNFGKFSDWYKTRGYAPKTRKSAREHLLALWRYAVDLGLTAIPDSLQRGSRSKYRDPNDSTKLFQLEDSEGTLWRLCQTFFGLRAKIRTNDTRRYYAMAIKAYGVHLGRQPLISDLNDDEVTRWLIATMETAKSVSTVRERIGRVLTLWKWAAERRVVEQFPTVERPPASDPDPIAFTEDELARLFESAAKERGVVGGVRAKDWWRAWLAFVLHTAERCGAASQLRWEWVSLTTGVVKIPAGVRKGHRKHAVYHLEPEVVELLKKIQSPKRELVFPWHRCRETYYNSFGRILERAGLPNDRKHKTHALRATHATLKTILGGDASRALGHSSRETTERHYIDKRHLPPDPVKLPSPWVQVKAPCSTKEQTANPSLIDAEALGWL